MCIGSSGMTRKGHPLMYVEWDYTYGGTIHVRCQNLQRSCMKYKMIFQGTFCVLLIMSAVIYMYVDVTITCQFWEWWVISITPGCAFISIDFTLQAYFVTTIVTIPWF